MDKSIMIIEDDQVFHDLYTEMLEDMNSDSFMLMMEMRRRWNWRKKNLI